MILQNRRELFGSWMRGTPSWIVDGEIVENKETQLNHLGIAKGTRRKVGRSGKALCGEVIIDQDALLHELQTRLNWKSAPVIVDLPQCLACKRVVMSWIMDEDSFLSMP